MDTTESNSKESDETVHQEQDRVEKIVERERVMNQARQRSTTKQDSENTLREFLNRVASRLNKKLKTPVMGRVTEIKPTENNNIELVVNVDGTETVERLAVPESPTEYAGDPKLVRLLDYIGANKTNISALRGEQVPVRPSYNRYDVVAPTRFNAVALSIFRLWQFLYRYKLIRHGELWNRDGDADELTQRGIAMVTPITTVIGFGGFYHLSMLSVDFGAVSAFAMRITALLLLAVGIMSGLVLGRVGLEWLAIKSIETYRLIKYKLGKYSPF